MDKVKTYGKELILDLHECNVNLFNRKSLKRFFKELCELIDMQRSKLVWWDDQGVPDNEKQQLEHTKGTSAVQFILTSNITIHTLDLLGNAYINIFSCKDFDEKMAETFTVVFFEGRIKQSITIDRL